MPIDVVRETFANGDLCDGLCVAWMAAMGQIDAHSVPMPREREEAPLSRLTADFALDARPLYSAEDLARGGIEAEDRMGRPSLFPLLRCSAAVLGVPEGQVLSDLGQVSRRIAERDAKRNPPRPRLRHRGQRTAEASRADAGGGVMGSLETWISPSRLLCAPTSAID